MNNLPKLGTVQVVDQAGNVVEERRDAFHLLPPRPGVCPECAVNHPADQPHNQQSLHYQYHFYGTHKRWPTWTDAMAHCLDDVKAAWRKHLVALMKKVGQDVPADLQDARGPNVVRQV